MPQLKSARAVYVYIIHVEDSLDQAFLAFLFSYVGLEIDGGLRLTPGARPIVLKKTVQLHHPTMNAYLFSPVGLYSIIQPC